jgi:response regulator RpfG family c-di-GMP phosphodiesterase
MKILRIELKASRIIVIDDEPVSIIKKISNNRAILEQAIADRTQELQQTQHEIIRPLGYAADYRDTDTANHTLRVGWYCKLLGQAIGMKKEPLDMLFQTAPMHDIGKIGIPDSSGYPRGLAGKDIPLNGRIVSILCV